MCSPVQVRVQGESEDAGMLLGEGSMCTVHEGEGARLPSAFFFLQEEGLPNPKPNGIVR